jgi:serine/threonine protein kinase
MVPSERLPAGGHEAITVAGGDCEPAQFYAAIYEYAGQKDLKSFLKQREYWRGDVVCMSRVFDDILAGLEYLHSWSLLHCDIKVRARSPHQYSAFSFPLFATLYINLCREHFPSANLHFAPLHVMTRF